MPAPDAPLPRFGERGLIALIGLCLMLQPLSTDLNLASLPGLATAFGAPVATVQLTLSVFVVGFGVMQLVSGPLSDRFGRRPALQGGLVVYVVASAACALAPTIGWLIAARFVQALGCCTAVVVARAIVRDAFTPAEGARALSRASSLLAIGPIFGPIVGSLLEVEFGFRAAFVLLTALGAALLAITSLRLAETNRHLDPTALAPRALAATCARVLRAPMFRAYALAGLASYAGLFAFISGSPFVLIRILDVPTGWFGLVWGAAVTGYLAGTLLARRLLRHRSLAATMMVGAWLALGGGALLAAVALADLRHWVAFLAAQFVYFGAHGILFPGAMAGVVAPFPRHAGAAAGMFGLLTMVAAAAVGSWIGASHDGTLRPVAFTVALAALVAFAAVRLGVRRVDAAAGNRR